MLRLLAAEMDRLRDEKQAEGKDAERKTHLMEVGLLKVVGALIYRGELNSDPATGLLINGLFVRVLEWLLQETDSEDAVTTVFKMLNADLRFYEIADTSSALKKYFGGRAEEAPLEFIDTRAPVISPFYLRIVNAFCKMGGFDVYRERMAKTEPTRAPLPCVRMMLRVLLKIAPFVKTDLVHEQVAKLKDPCLEMLSYYTENRGHDQGAQYESANETAMALLQLHFTESELEAEFLEFQLRGALGNIRSNVLERKLHGIRYVNGVVKRAQKWIEKENAGRFAKLTSWLRMDDDDAPPPPSQSGSMSGPPLMGPLAPGEAVAARRPKPIKPLDPKRVVTWLSDNRVLDDLLQASAHEAVVKQAIPVLIFLASCDASLDVTKYISLMWEISLDHHESVRSIIFSSIVHLSETLPLADVEFTYGLLKKLPLEKYDEQTLEFLKAFCTNANAKFGKEAKRFFGLEIYWALFQDSDKVPTEVQKRAASHFSTILEADSCAPLVQTYLEKVVELLREGHSLGQSLKLFSRLAWVQDTRKKKRTIETLEERFRVMDAFFWAVSKYKQSQVGVKQQENAGGAPGKYGRRYSHLQVVQTVFDWLDWVLKHSTLTLTTEQVDTLWKLFVEEQQQPPQEAEVFFKWLTVDEDKVDLILNPKVVEHILLNKMLAGDFATSLTSVTYRAFRRFFLLHNVRIGSIRRVGSATAATALAVERYSATGSGTIVGLDKLWAVALDAKSEDVAMAAAELLNDLFLFPQQKTQGLRESHVAQCMKGVAGEQSVARLQRSLRMLYDMHEAYDKVKGAQKSSSVPGQASGGMIGGGSRLNLFIRIDVGNGFLLPDVDSHTTLEQLKKMIGDRLGGMSGMFMRLFIEDKELTSMKSTLSHARIADKTEITVRQSGSLASRDEIGFDSLAGMLVQSILKGLGLRPAAPSSLASNSPPPPQASSSTAPVICGIATRLDSQVAHTEDGYGEFAPAILMSQEKHFDAIFALLSHADPRIVASAWRLLDRLPSAPALRGAFAEKTPDFNKLLPVGGGYRLVYSLQLLESMAHAQSWTSASEAARWRVSAVKSNLVGVLQSLALHYASGEAAAEDAAPTIRLIAIRLVSIVLRDEECRAAQPALENSLVCLAEVLKCAAATKQVMPEDVELSGRVADAWLCIVTPKSSVNIVAIVPDFDLWVQTVLLHAVSDQIRAQAARCLASVTHPQSFARLLNVILKLLPDLNKWGARAVQLMALLEGFAKNGGNNSSSKELTSVVLIVARVIQDRPIVEESIDAGNEDWCLCAMMSLLAAVLSRNREQKEALGGAFLSHLFWDCLFALPDSNQIMEKLQPPKCKTDLTRVTALRLLTELCRGCPFNYLAVTKFVWKQGLELTEKHRSKALVTATGKPRGPNALIDVRQDGGFSVASEAWMLTPMGDLRSGKGFVGLQNLGATCYMNSLLQQLFFSPRFAEGILNAPLIALNELVGAKPDAAGPAPPSSNSSVATTTSSSSLSKAESGSVASTSGKDDEIEGDKDAEAPVDPFADHVLAQLQMVVCNLKYSNRKYFNTRAFASSNKDMDGRPINTGMQQDAIEYFNSLFERLEFFAGRDKRAHRFLKEIFGGTLSNQLICKDGCTHTRERKEPFYSISVEIKNKPNLYKSLELYVEGEMLEGENAYFCEECNAKRPTLKRAVLHELPNVLVVHLKRFEFSYETLTHSKLNQYFEFPEQLDVFPFTGEGLVAQGDPTATKQHPDAYYQYRLRGVVIHAGGASAGHYYSLIRGEDGSWREFNDSNVRSFDFQNMRDEAFGGTYNATVRDGDTGQERIVQRERINNAYLLVYERVEEFPLAEEQIEPTSSGTPEPVPAELPKGNPGAVVERVLQDNVANLHGRYMSSSQYYQWLWEFLNLYSISAEKDHPEVFHETVSLTLFLLLHVMGRTRDSVMGSIWSGHMARMCSVSKSACDWLMRRMLEGGLGDKAPEVPRFHYLYDFLCRCPRPRTRMALVEVLQATVERLSRDSAATQWIAPGTKLPELGSDAGDILKRAPTHVVLVDRMLSEVPTLMSHSLQFMTHWFRVFRVFAELGANERQYLVSRGAVEYLLELIQLKGRFGLNKAFLSLTDVSPISRNIKNATNALGCLSVIVKGSVPPTEAQLNEIIGDHLSHATVAAGGGASKTLRKKKLSSASAPAAPPPKNPFQAAGARLVELSTNSWKELIGRELVQRLCEERWCVSELLEMLEYLVWEDQGLTHYFLIVLFDGLKRCKSVEALGGFLTCLEGILQVGDSFQALRAKDIVSALMSAMERAVRTRSSKTVAASEVHRYQAMLLGAAKNSVPSHPLRKLVLSKEREIQDFRSELGMKPLLFELQ